MRVLAALVVAAAVASLLVRGVVAQSTTPNVSVAPSSVKILPNDGPTSDTSAEIHVAQNEFEAFQVVVSGPASDVAVAASTLVGPSGTVIPGSEVRLYREAYLDISKPSSDEGGAGRWPDALIPDVDETANERRNAFPFDVPAGENRVVWVEVHVPQGQRPGHYQGSLTVTGAGLGTIAVPVMLRVWDFELPSTSSIRSTFGMGWDTVCLAHYGSYEACGYDVGVERLRLLYARFMLDHRITADPVYYGPTGCSGSDCNWTHFDDTYGAFFDGADSNLRLTGARPTSIRYNWVADSAHYAAWAQHFRQRGWFGLTYDYTCDEPPNGCEWNSINPRAAMVHGADPDFPTLVTTNIDEAGRNGITGSINILSPTVNHVDDKPGSAYTGNQRPKYDPFLLSDPRNRLWWYQACMTHGCFIQGGPYFSGWPSLMVDNTAVQNRAQGMLSWLYDVSGVLYYRIDLHLADAWRGADYLYDFGGNGDGTLLYAGTPSEIGGETHIPVASIRLKMIREGFEDYEYMKLVSDLGDPAFAEQTGRTLFPRVFAARQSPSALNAAREALAQRILALKDSTANNAQVSLISPLTLTPPSPAANEVVTVSFMVQNTGGRSITVPYFLAGGRNAAGTHFDFPVTAPVTLQPGDQFTYRGSQSFSDPGSYTAWPAWFDGTNWIELAPHGPFTVSASASQITRVEENNSTIVLGPTQWSWNTGSEARTSGGTYIASSGGNATLRFTFTGTAISVIGVTDSCSGQARIDLDGSAQTIDAYRAAGGVWQQVLFSASGLANSSHALTITVLGTKQTASCGSWIYIDAFDIAGGATPPATR